MDDLVHRLNVIPDLASAMPRFERHAGLICTTILISQQRSGMKRLTAIAADVLSGCTLAVNTEPVYLRCDWANA